MPRKLYSHSEEAPPCSQLWLGDTEDVAGLAQRSCAWLCKSKIGERRGDAKFCSTRCRQAYQRFANECPRRPPAIQKRRFGVWDPPYLGKSGYYLGHKDYGGEVDHEELVAKAGVESPDGWILAASSDSSRTVWAMCPPDTRLAIWSRGARPNPKAKGSLRAWEAVFVHGGREQVRGPGPDERVEDVLEKVLRPRTTSKTRVMGAKPAAWCYWVFELLGARPGDEMVDGFPGSGAVTLAWQIYNDRALPPA